MRPGYSFNSSRWMRGFTLIELMFVVAIVAILTAIALPNYFEQVRKSRRADAVSALMHRDQLLERCFTRTQAYTDDSCPDPAGPTENGFYTISVERTANTWTLTATPQGRQAGDACGTYTLDHLGNKTPSPDNKRCWGSA